MNDRRASAGIRALIWISGFLLFLVVVGFFLVRSVALFAGPSHVEVARAASPDGAIDAVVIETNGGATTDFGYRVELVGRQEIADPIQVASLYGARRSDCAYGVNLRWAGPTRLLIEYENARQTGASPAVVEGKTVAVELKPGVPDPSAACGGMEYNLRAKADR